jgi:hypothetical protein
VSDQAGPSLLLGGAALAVVCEALGAGALTSLDLEGCLCAHASVCKPLYMCVYMCVCVCVRVCVCVCVSVCVCVCMSACMYVHAVLAWTWKGVR